MSEIPKSQTNKTVDEDHDALFACHANAAWGIAFATTEAVSTATDAVASGFADLFQARAEGAEITSARLAVIKNTRDAALAIKAEEPVGEPVSLLGETNDRQATLALTALDESSRSLLWIVDAEGLTSTEAASILGIPAEEVDSKLDVARADFRRQYVDATRRDGMNSECVEVLDQLAAYSDHSLEHDAVATVDAHLIDCDQCRNIAARLTDIEGRLRAAIPSIPAWTRQYVADTWETIANSAALFSRRPVTETEAGQHLRIVAYVAATLIVVAATVIGLSFSPDKTGGNKESASSKLSAPSTTTSTVPTDGPSVATPIFPLDDESNTPQSERDTRSTEPNMNSSQTPVGAADVEITSDETSNATTTTTQPENRHSENRLVDLPPATVKPTATTSTTKVPTTTTTQPAK